MARPRKRKPDLDALPSCLAWYGEVLTGRVAANKAIRQMAEREANDFLYRQRRDDFPYVFHVDLAERALAFYRLLPFVSGERAGQSFQIENWQAAFFSSLTGWRMKGDVKVRRYLRAILQVPRKSGKTFMAACYGLRELIASPSGGAEVYSLATKVEQASLSIDVAKKMITRLGREHPMTRRVHCYSDGIEIVRGGESRWWKALSSRAKGIEGVGASLAIIDEAALIENRALISSIQESGRGRRSPMTLYISTAQDVHQSPYLEVKGLLEQGLDGGEADERLFGLVFTIDREPRESDDEMFMRIAETPDLWRASNPNLGISHYVEHIESDMRDARLNPAMRAEVLLKTFNVFVNASSEKFLELSAWDACGQGKREGVLYAGIDIGIAADFTSLALVWDHGTGKYTGEVKCFAPRVALEKVTAENRSVFQAAIDAGELVIMGERALDMAAFCVHLLNLCKAEGVSVIGIDPWMASDVVDACEGAGHEILAIKQGTMLTMGIYRLEQLIAEGRFQQAGKNRLLRWMVANARRVEKRGLVMLEKPAYEKKIDGVMALVNAVLVSAHGRSRVATCDVYYGDDTQGLDADADADADAAPSYDPNPFSWRPGMGSDYDELYSR